MRGFPCTRKKIVWICIKKHYSPYNTFCRKLCATPMLGVYIYSKHSFACNMHISKLSVFVCVYSLMFLLQIIDSRTVRAASHTMHAIYGFVGIIWRFLSGNAWRIIQCEQMWKVHIIIKKITHKLGFPFICIILTIFFSLIKYMFKI